VPSELADKLLPPKAEALQRRESVDAGTFLARTEFPRTGLACTRFPRGWFPRTWFTRAWFSRTWFTRAWFPRTSPPCTSFPHTGRNQRVPRFRVLGDRIPNDGLLRRAKEVGKVGDDPVGLLIHLDGLLRHYAAPLLIIGRTPASSVRSVFRSEKSVPKYRSTGPL
jgi:hypothetical protein